MNNFIQISQQKIECLEKSGFRSFCEKGLCCGSLYCCNPFHGVCKNDVCIPKFAKNTAEFKFTQTLMIVIIVLYTINFFILNKLGISYLLFKKTTDVLPVCILTIFYFKSEFIVV